MMNDKVIQYAKKQMDLQKAFLESDSGKAFIKMQVEAMERMEESGQIELMERMEEIYKVLLPLFPSLPSEDKEKVIESYEVVENPHSEPEIQEKAVKSMERIVKRNPSKQTRLILEELIPYFENDIRYKVKSENPELDVNTYNKSIKTNFMQEIANKYELTLRRIKQIAKDYKDDYKDFLPDKVK